MTNPTTNINTLHSTWKKTRRKGVLGHQEASHTLPEMHECLLVSYTCMSFFIIIFSQIQKNLWAGMIIIKKLLWKDIKKKQHNSSFKFLFLKAFWLFHFTFNWLSLYLVNTSWGFYFPSNGILVIFIIQLRREKTYFFPIN